MKRALLVAAASLLLSSPAWSQPYGMGPGMMGGYGPGYGMGPGMMGGYGPGYGMGPGMMGGNGGQGIPDLTSEQRTKIAEIQKDLQRKQWALMQSMHELMWRDDGAYRDGRLDENAARKAYDAAADLRKRMFENSLDARKRMDDLLTPQQREQMSRTWGGR